MHASIGGVGVIYHDTFFVDNRDMDKINPILQKFPDTLDGPALLSGWALSVFSWKRLEMKVD